MYCPKCGTQNDENNYKCNQCGNVLKTAAPAPAPVVQPDGTFGGLIPKNTNALLAYYFGIFSLILAVLAIPAIICGLLGLSYANKNPQAKGKAHAWSGIIIGGLVIVGWIALIAFVF